MALVKDLMGVGIQAEAANLLGFTSGAVAAAGSSSDSAATAIGKANTFPIVTVASGSANGVKLPADAELMQPYVIVNISSTAGVIFPPTGGSINGDTTTSGSVPLTARGTTICWRYSATGWAAVGGAAG